MECKICNEITKDKRAFGYHLQFVHKIKVEDYAIQFFYNGKRPTCPICNEPTRYVRTSHSFKKYCKVHAREAMREGGKKGGRASIIGIRIGRVVIIDSSTEPKTENQKKKLPERMESTKSMDVEITCTRWSYK